MKKLRMVGGFVVLTTAIGIAVGTAPAGAVADVCVARTSSRLGAPSWRLRQASGLALSNTTGVLLTHNDRGIRDVPDASEDTENASVWAVNASTGKELARFRLTAQDGTPIPYFDTEAIGRDPQGRVVLADTGTNVDGRVVVALYRFTPPAVTADQAFVEPAVTAEVIPLAYYNNATTSTKVKLNVESMSIDSDGNAWLVPRKTGKPYAYVATAAALNAASGTTTPARAVRSTQLTVAGPMTDASFSPDGSMLLVKSMSTVYAYAVTGLTPGTAASAVANALKTTPCAVATAARAKDPGYGEAVVARADGGFFTIAEANKKIHTGNASPIFGFNV